jgi:hypothetical protein
MHITKGLYAALLAGPLLGLAMPSGAAAQMPQSGTQAGLTQIAAAGGGFRREGGGFRGFRGGGGFRGYRGYGGPYFSGSLFFGPGFGFYDPFYDPFWGPYYYRPRVIVRERIPAQGYLPPPEGPAPEASWYRCDNPAGYYPYVRTCNGQWQAVPVTPDDAPPGPPPQGPRP